MNVENGIIESADIVLEEPCGKQGLNCLLRLWVELSGGGVGISFNPVKIPLILENLGVKSLKKLGVRINTNVPVGNAITLQDNWVSDIKFVKGMN